MRSVSWEEGSTLQFITLVVSQKLEMDIEEAGAKLAELALLMPDLVLVPGRGMLSAEDVGGVERQRALALAALVQDLPALALKLIVLREMLPGTDVSRLVSRCPELVLSLGHEQLRAQLTSMRDHLPGVRLAPLLAQHPQLLQADIPALLHLVSARLPHADPVQVLLAQTQVVLHAAGSAVEPELRSQE